MNQLSDRLNSLSPSATLAMSQKSNELKAQGVDVINLSVGEPDFNTPDHIKEAAKKAVDDNFSRYSPVPGYPALRNAIVEKLKKENGLEYTAAQISCANGAKQSVCNAILVLVNPGDEVIVPAPYWVSYPEMVKLAEGTPVIVSAGIEQDFKITPEQLEAAITPKTKALILCSPSNPTGSVYSKEELAGLAAVLAKHPQVIMKSILFVPVKDYIKSRKKLYVKFIFPMVVATTALAITLFFNFGDGEKLNAVFSEFISTQINIIAILISFSIAIITILVSADNHNIQELKNTLSNEKHYHSVNGKQLSLFQILLSNIAYNIICETVYLIFLIAVALTKSIFPLQSLKYVSAICIFVILHILLVLLESVAQMYLTFWDKK